MSDICRITIDTRKERAVIAYLLHRKLKFVQLENKLQRYNPCTDKINP